MRPRSEPKVGMPTAEEEATEAITVLVSAHLHRDSQELVKHFAKAIALKLRSAELKYGYRDGWKTQDWEAECRQHMLEHVDKGDPTDVAVYCAFMWSRGWPTSATKDDLAFTKALPVNATIAMAEAGAASKPGLSLADAASIYRAMIQVAPRVD